MDNEYGSLVVKWVCDRDSAQTRWSNLMKFYTQVFQSKISVEFVFGQSRFHRFKMAAIFSI